MVRAARNSFDLFQDCPGPISERKPQFVVVDVLQDKRTLDVSDDLSAIRARHVFVIVDRDFRSPKIGKSVAI